MISHFGVTADSPVNSYSSGKPLDGHARKYLGKRLDYIFFRQPSVRESHSPVLSCSHSKVVFTDLVPRQNFSFSDHFGIEATLDIHDDSSPGFSNLQTHSPSTRLSPTSIETTIAALTTCHQISTHRSTRELNIFGLCIFLLFALTISSAWLPTSWTNSIYLLFTVFVAWLATTMFYEGFLYGRWELNALMNVIEELDIHRDHLRSGHKVTRGQVSWNSEPFTEGVPIMRRSYNKLDTI